MIDEERKMPEVERLPFFQDDSSCLLPAHVPLISKPANYVARQLASWSVPSRTFWLLIWFNQRECNNIRLIRPDRYS